MLWLLHGGIFNHVAYFLSFSCSAKIVDSINVKSKKQSLLFSQVVLLRGSALAHADTLGERISHQGVEPGQHILIVSCAGCGGGNSRAIIMLRGDYHLFSAWIILIHCSKPSGCARGDRRETSGIGNRRWVRQLALKHAQDGIHTGLGLLVAYMAGLRHCRTARIADNVNARDGRRFIAQDIH